MATLAQRLPSIVSTRGSPLDRIPGSDAHTELFFLLRDATRFFHQRFEAHGRVFKSRLVYPVVFLIGEEANKTITVTQRHDFRFGLGYAQTAVRRVFEGSIMLQDGEDHRRMRGILSPAIGTLAVRECTEAVVGIWGRAAEALRSGESHDAYALAERTTFDVAANVLTGLALGEETEAFRPHFERLIAGIMAPTNLRVPFGRLDRALTARRTLARLLEPRVLAARQREPKGLLGQLAHFRDEAGHLLPEGEIIGHLLLLFWAGYDTTASAASWVLHELAQRPSWQERLRAEFESGRDVHSGNGTLLHWFLLEIERAYPSALFFPRIAERDVTFADYRIPAGTPVFYSPYMSHRDPATFVDPNAFEPERWDPSRKGHVSPAKLFGFGGGPRVCLGKAFAKLQLKIMLHEILTRFRVEPEPSCRPTVQTLPVHHPRGSLLRFKAL